MGSQLSESTSATAQSPRPGDVLELVEALRSSMVLDAGALRSSMVLDAAALPLRGAAPPGGAPLQSCTLPPATPVPQRTRSMPLPAAAGEAGAAGVGGGQPASAAPQQLAGGWGLHHAASAAGFRLSGPPAPTQSPLRSPGLGSPLPTSPTSGGGAPAPCQAVWGLRCTWLGLRARWRLHRSTLGFVWKHTRQPSSPQATLTTLACPCPSPCRAACSRAAHVGAGGVGAPADPAWHGERRSRHSRPRRARPSAAAQPQQRGCCRCRALWWAAHPGGLPLCPHLAGASPWWQHRLLPLCQWPSSRGGGGHAVAGSHAGGGRRRRRYRYPL